MRNYFSEGESVPWYYEELHVLAKGTSKLLATEPVGKVVDMDHFLEIVRDIPVQQGQADWNCVTWVQEVLHEVSQDATALEMKTSGYDWPSMRDSVVEVAAQKAAAR